MTWFLYRCDLIMYSNDIMRTIAWRSLHSDERGYNVAFIPPRQVAGVPHNHDFAECFLLTGGALTHVVNGQRIALTAGWAALVRPEDAHCFKVRAHDATGRLINVAFPEPVLRELSGRIFGEGPLPPGFDGAVPRHVRLDDEQTDNLAVEAESLLTAPPPGRFALERFLLNFLHAMRGRMEEAESGGGPDWLRNACRAMARPENLRGGLPVLHRLCGRCPEHVARSMRRRLGTTPTDFINDLRLDRAGELLRHTGLSIDGVAEECGFRNHAYFYRRFKRRFGATPRAYRLKRAVRIA